MNLMTKLPSEAPSAPQVSWDFLTNHAHVLLCIARNPECRIRDLAEQVGITERAVQRIVSDLEDAGYLAHARDGRRNRYEVKPDVPFRHPLEQHRNIAELISMVFGQEALRPRVTPLRPSAPETEPPATSEARATSAASSHEKRVPSR